MSTAVITMRGAAPDCGWTAGHMALTPIGNRPLLLHAVDTVRAADVDHIAVVGDADALAVARPLLDPDIERVEVGSFATAAESVLAVGERLRGERIIVHDAQGLLVRGVDSLSSAVADHSADATVFYKELGKRICGVHVFSDSILGALRRDCTLVDAVDRLAAGGGRVQAGVLSGWWSWNASPERLLEVNRNVLDAMEPASARSSLEDTRLEGRVRIHPTARLRAAVVRGPVIIGAHARVTDAYVGPYTTVGDGATIENSEIESSIVLPRARICHVGVRVESSIIGEDAHVSRDFSLPKALRLSVGTGASVLLS
jgi:NDP-sugar pyrophosphorylase family protein